MALLQSQQEFIQALKTFIESQPHYINNQGTFTQDSRRDTETYTIDDPDGDYESLDIIISGKP